MQGEMKPSERGIVRQKYRVAPSGRNRQCAAAGGGHQRKAWQPVDQRREMHYVFVPRAQRTSATCARTSFCWGRQMSDFSIKIASSPNTITELAAVLKEKRSRIPVSVNQSASHRDFSIVEVALTAVTTEAIRVVFATLKEFITEKLKKGDTQKGFAIQIDGTSIEIKAEGDLTKLENVEKAKKAEVGHA